MADDTALAESEQMTSALAHQVKPPDEILRQAHLAAKALKGVLDQKPKKVMMNEEQYLEFEDWQTVGRFYGVTAKEDGDPEFVKFGEAEGFKASAVALNSDGDVISRATAFCMTDEEKWGSRPKYVWLYKLKKGGLSKPGEDPLPGEMVWIDNPNGKKKANGDPAQLPDKVRTLVGVEKVPLFQMASMAQTRAAAKVLRNVLSWVVVLAGYRPTPAEELETETVDQKPKQEPPKQEPPKQQQQPPKTNGKPPTEPQTRSNVPPPDAGDAWEPDASPIKLETIDGIAAYMEKIGRVWDAKFKEKTSSIIGRKVGLNEALKDLTEVEGMKIIDALKQTIGERDKKTQQPAA